MSSVFTFDKQKNFFQKRYESHKKNDGETIISCDLIITIWGRLIEFVDNDPTPDVDGNIYCICGELKKRIWRIPGELAGDIFGDPGEELPDGRIQEIQDIITALLEQDIFTLTTSTESEKGQIFLCNSSAAYADDPTSIIGYLTPHLIDVETGENPLVESANIEINWEIITDVNITDSDE